MNGKNILKPNVAEIDIFKKIEKEFSIRSQKAPENLRWLAANMHPYFFITMRDQPQAIGNLALHLNDISKELKITIMEEEKKLIVARTDVHGSIYETLKGVKQRDITYAEMSHSYKPLPSDGRNLEILRLEFDQKGQTEILSEVKNVVPPKIYKLVRQEMKRLYPFFDFKEFKHILDLIWLNNPSYVLISPPQRIARVMHLYQQGKRHHGLYLDVEIKEMQAKEKETRILFSVGNPPKQDFLTQVSEVFQRLKIGVRRSYCLVINTGIHPYFLGTFYVLAHDGELIEKGTRLFERLKTELYNTQMLSSKTSVYKAFILKCIMTGEEASLTNAFIAFCHTFLAHIQPDRFSSTEVTGAFLSEPDISQRLIKLFQQRFDPKIKNRVGAYKTLLIETRDLIKGYSTGHKYLDEIRKTVFKVCLSFITNTLKTNFFVSEKHAIAFRIDPSFMKDLVFEHGSDLPNVRPYRITFFFTRKAVGYHIGFSDIARGGWRTIICRDQNELTTNTKSLFREVFVLAHTQHLKNKDIYQGGSKLTVVLDATDLDRSLLRENELLYKVQYGIINAFFDIFTTKQGKVINSEIVDYYKEEEPIEIGPDENMHDSMIEYIAKESLKRNYILGIGAISSKSSGINHKRYGVTSRGVVKFAEIGMLEHGINIYKESFSVKFTGGPNGDVAGNAMQLLLERCPNVQIRSIIDGTALLYDPKGVDRTELKRLLLNEDLDQFAAKSINPDGFIIFRSETRREGLRELYKKVRRIGVGIEEEWITLDEVQKETDQLIFKCETDLFLPCGGRPEAIDGRNWKRMISGGGDPHVKLIVEGANSFISPEAREGLQRNGVIILKDSSANKCGVISSSYEVIANLMMTEKEFLANKARYVSDVLSILERKAENEAHLIFKRYHNSYGKMLFTDISDSISVEINNYYSELFSFFQNNHNLLEQPIFRKAILYHLPNFIRNSPKYRRRVATIPLKIKCAILASEIASSIVYQGGWDIDFESMVKRFLKVRFSKAANHSST